jgi:hypothetical protein
VVKSLDLGPRVHPLIKRGAQIVGDVANYEAPSRGALVGDLDAQNFLAGIRVHLNHKPIRLQLQIIVDLANERTEVLFGPLDLQPWPLPREVECLGPRLTIG